MSKLHNPKLDEHPVSNAEKDPANWESGDEPITGAQASYLATLCEEAGVTLPDGDLTKAEASVKIDEMRLNLVENDNGITTWLCRACPTSLMNMGTPSL